MPTSPAILDLRRRIQRKRADGRPVFVDVIRLQALVHAELQASIETAEIERARDRREPGSFQRELELDE
ncbi:hypothetical protein [Methylopila sp. M107]|uniref:hypothetical protein n=1 Tax=Methylopila sp. M107 TaxID=1101190 RepID=UPI000379D5B9|nr:hypothetical protein [Methylopila sp. M107]